ncbi:hypothetical protein [Roseovarius sp. D0-M9]|uniref:hypothetical protein n=1 Tax=Roseovarius sp. D0-M9 TaxID=3127117 RepID=UPI00300FBBB5
MIVRDKGVLADALGAQHPWNMSGTPELIVTDCGSAFIDFDTRAGATDLLPQDEENREGTDGCAAAP